MGGAEDENLYRSNEERTFYGFDYTISFFSGFFRVNRKLIEVTFFWCIKFGTCRSFFCALRPVFRLNDLVRSKTMEWINLIQLHIGCEPECRRVA